MSLIFVLVFMCTACWNYREINDMSLIEGLAIDKRGDEYHITGKLLIATTEHPTQGTLQHFFVNASGHTIFDAIRNLILKDGKKVYFGHLHYIIISEQIAREGINQVLDIFMRDIESREDMWVFVASPGFVAEDVLYGISYNELATYIEDATANAKNIAKFYPSKMYELIECINEKGRDGLAPLVSKTPSVQGETAHIEGSAVFNNNTMVGTLSGDESKTLMFVLGRGTSSVIPLIYTDDQHTSKVSLEVIKNKTEIMPIYLDGGCIKMRIHVYLNVVIGEIMNNKVNVTSPQGQEKLIAATSAFVKNNIEALIVRAQKEFKSDIFSFGEMVKNSNPTVWKDIAENWHDIFQGLEIDMDVTVKIYGSNLYKQIITKPHNMKD